MKTKQINKIIAENVCALRHIRGYSQENMADMLGVTRSSYVNMEAGRQSIKALFIYTLCRIFNSTPSKLFPKIEPLILKPKIIRKKVAFTRIKKQYSKIK